MQSLPISLRLLTVATLDIHDVKKLTDIQQGAHIPDSYDLVPLSSPTACHFQKLCHAGRTSAHRSKPHAREREELTMVFNGLRGAFALYLCSAAPRDTTLEDAALGASLHPGFRSAALAVWLDGHSDPG